MDQKTVSLQEQIKRLEALELEGKRHENTVRMRRRRQMLAANRRLQIWAEWSVGARRGDTAYISSPASAMAGLGVLSQGTRGQVSGMPDDIYDTDRAVALLSNEQRQVLEMEYFSHSLLQRQRAEKLNISLRCYEDRLRKARQQVYCYLYAPGSNSCKVFLEKN